MPRLPLLAAVLAVAVVAPSAAHGRTYYVSMGDSLAAGYQKNAAGVGAPTRNGYTDVVFARTKQRVKDLQVVKLGCPGETTTTFIAGGRCQYTGGSARGKSQLDAAKRFLKANRARVRMATLTIGANDVVACARGVSVDLDCVLAGIATAQRNLPRIGRELRKAAGRKVRVAVFLYYDPFLAFYLRGSDYHNLAELSIGLTQGLNQPIAETAAKQRFRIANGFTAFKTTTTTPTQLDGADVPTNVAQICRYTYMCAPPPQGPDVHLTTTGYRLVAGLFERALR